MPKVLCECGKQFSSYGYHASHKFHGKCAADKIPPKPVETKKERCIPLPTNRKRTLEEAIGIGKAYEQYPRGQKKFCSDHGISRGLLKSSYARYQEAEEQRKKNPNNMLTKKELQSRSMGSGKTRESMCVITAAMAAVMLNYIRVHRGPTHATHMHHNREENEWSLYDKDGTYLPVDVVDLVHELSLWHDAQELTKVFDDVGELKWARRVRDWCREQGISRRKFNKKSRSPEKEKVTANRCLGTFQELERIRMPGDRYANMDETSMRILSMHATSLHWRGAKDVPVAEELTSKLCLSMPVIWYDDGTMDFMVLWSNGSRKPLDWTEHSGVWWLQAPSKMTRTSTYPEVLKFFTSRQKKFEKYFDDCAQGHSGRFPECFFESLPQPVKRIRILGTCTAYNQPADRPQANKELKNLVRKHMRKLQLRRALQREVKLLKGLTLEARKAISDVLHAVRKEFNASARLTEGVRNAFQETLLSDKKHSGLAKLLKKADGPEYKPYGSFGTKYVCPCSFKSDKSSKHNCWHNRAKLWAPFETGQRPSDPTCLMFRAEKRDGSESFVGAVLDEAAYRFSPELSLLEGKWWNEYDVRYFERKLRGHKRTLKQAAQLNWELAKAKAEEASAALEKARNNRAGRKKLFSLRQASQDAQTLVDRAAQMKTGLEL